MLVVVGQKEAGRQKRGEGGCREVVHVAESETITVADSQAPRIELAQTCGQLHHVDVGSQSSLRMRRSSGTDAPSSSANLGNLSFVSSRVSYSIKRPSDPPCAVRMDLGGMPFES